MQTLRSFIEWLDITASVLFVLWSGAIIYGYIR